MVDIVHDRVCSVPRGPKTSPMVALFVYHKVQQCSQTPEASKMAGQGIYMSISLGVSCLALVAWLTHTEGWLASHCQCHVSVTFSFGCFLFIFIVTYLFKFLFTGLFLIHQYLFF